MIALRSFVWCVVEDDLGLFLTYLKKIYRLQSCCGEIWWPFCPEVKNRNRFYVQTSKI